MQRREDPESPHAAQALTSLQEECLGINISMLTLVEDKLLITDCMYKKQWLKAEDQPKGGFHDLQTY